jgi:NAD(P)-dependent dehydrogenase (short-subunit alcohol dehydrogenase family)
MRSTSPQEQSPRVAIITAASQGIGAGVARYLAQSGYKVGLLARSDRIFELARELDGVAVSGSVTEPGDLTELLEKTLERWGQLDAIVNNTGHPAKGDLLSLSDEDWLEGYQLILGSVIRIARLATPHLEKTRGAVVNISSYAAARPELQRPLSSVFRSALSSWTQVYAQHCAPLGIRVNSVMPGFVDSYSIDEDTRTSIPLGRIGRVEEVAQTVAFLLSEGASYITGQNLLVDGGMVRQL